MTAHVMIIILVLMMFCTVFVESQNDKFRPIFTKPGVEL